ncbi:hypothetical protein K2X92_01300 [Candidatus Gracilibacteria bacterium]|nr:hypothetical protein [Candidatus Gracilibacteria bacterium]
MQDSTITIIPLQTAKFEAPNISHELVQILQESIASDKKILIFYARRGNARAWICGDCGHYEKCHHCDIALAYHTHPKKCLICHHCGYKAPFPIVCPECQGSKIDGVGVGIQQIEENLIKILGKDTRVLRIDGDTNEKTEILYENIDSHNIVLTTQIGGSIVHPGIGVVVYLLFELNLSLPSYHIEEDIYNEISYHKKQKLPIFIQTYTPEHPLLREIMDGNTKSFLAYLSRERKDFLYPPFAELATIRVHDEQKKKVEDIMRKLINKIGILKKETTFFAFDTDIYEKSHGEYQQKIVLKDKDLSYLLSELEVEIVRNRSVTLEWN